MFIGKEILYFTPVFDKLQYVRKAIHKYTQDRSDLFAETLIKSLKEQVILSTHNDFVSQLPPLAEVLSYSKTCQIEHWVIGE